MSDTTPDLAKCGPSVGTVTGWTVFFMVLLRIAIGWHFAYEGIWKLMQDDWRATGYLAASAGPLRPVFTRMIKDADGIEALTAESVKRRIDERYALMVKHYGLDENQRKETDPYAERKKVGDPARAYDKEYVDYVFADPDFQAQLADYRQLLEQIKTQETKAGKTEFDTERLVDMYKRKAKARTALLARAELPLRAMEINTRSKLTAKQLAKGPLPGEKSPTWFIDWSNMIALTAVGVCLMLGLFTRLAALGGIGLLAMYYFSMPPFPGLPESPMAEGHYLIVNKNLIEAIALLMIATSRAGRWAGLDAFFARFCACSRGRADDDSTVSPASAEGAPPRAL